VALRVGRHARTAPGGRRDHDRSAWDSLAATSRQGWVGVRRGGCGTVALRHRSSTKQRHVL